MVIILQTVLKDFLTFLSVINFGNLHVKKCIAFHSQILACQNNTVSFSRKLETIRSRTVRKQNIVHSIPVQWLQV